VPDIADESEGDVTTSINANERETLPTELDVQHVRREDQRGMGSKMKNKLQRGRI